MMAFRSDRLPFTVIIHRNGIVSANVCAVRSGGNMSGENMNGGNITGASIPIETNVNGSTRNFRKRAICLPARQIVRLFAVG